MSRRLTVLLTALIVFSAPAAAHAGWLPPQLLDGPNAEVLEAGNVDIARDGTGALSYLRLAGGVPEAYVSRLVGGAWRPAERLSAGMGNVTEVKLAVGDSHRLAVAWVANGIVWATSAPAGTGPGAYTPAVALGGPGAGSIDIDVGVNGVAYLVWEEGGNVAAARLQDATWTRLGAPLDIYPSGPAGTGALRPRVAVSAEGYAVATWGELMPDGLTHVFGRRLTGIELSQFPQDLTLPGGGSADSPDIDIEDDGSFAWIVFRQDVGGVSHTYGRRLIGTTYEPPEQLDAGIGSVDPKIDMSDEGHGFAVAQGGPWALGSWLNDDHFQSTLRLDGLDGNTVSKPEVASTDRNYSAAAWRLVGPGVGSIARARFRDSDATTGDFGGEVTVSRPDLGPVADPGVFVSGDRVGDFAVVMVQGEPGARSLVVASYDRPPGAPFIQATQAYKRQTRPLLRWRPGLELWGEQTFRVFMDGVQIGQTTRAELTPSTPLRTGRHTWYVEAVDQAGQVSRSRARSLRIDATAPTLRVKVSGKREADEPLKITVSVKDRGGSGLDHVTVDYGDKSRTSRQRSTRHRYKRGTYRLRVAAVDKAGNVTRKQTTLRIKKKS